MVNGDTVAVAKNRYAEVKAAFEEYAGVKRSSGTGDEEGQDLLSAKKVDKTADRE
jgi:hypothetical protein